MYASVNQWSFPGLSPLDCLRAAGEAGFTGFEPAFSEKGPLSVTEPGDALVLRGEAENLGIRIPSLASGLYWDYPFTSDDKSVRQRAVDIARAQIDCAAALGAKSILIVPGTVAHGFFGKGTTYALAYERAQEAMRQIEPHARASGVVIGVENVWNNFLLSPLEMRGFLDEIGSPFVRSYLDVGNMLPYGDSADWIRTLGERVFSIHVKDYRRSVGAISGFVPLLEGDVDWPEVMLALREIGFDGALTAEVNPVAAAPAHAARQAKLALDSILSM